MTGAIDSNLDPELDEIAQTMGNAIQAGDMDSWLAIYADDGVVWHSNTRDDMPAAANAAGLKYMFAEFLDEMRYEDIRRRAVDGGYVQQHTLYLRSKTGAEFRTAVCQILQVTGGRIVRMEEYLDSGVTAFAVDNGLALPPSP